MTPLDPSTVRFECAFPCPLLGPVTLADLPIIPKHVWGSVPDPGKLDALPIGTGPYRLVEYRSGHGYRFEANKSYFKGAPTVEELVMPIMDDPSTTFTALRTGEIDAAARPLPPELAEGLRAGPGIRLLRTSPLTIAELRLNFERQPFDDHSFRRALSLAVDREALVRTVLLGRGRPGTSGYPHPDSPWTNPKLAQPHDPAEGRALLDGLGWRDGDGDGVREGPDGRHLEFSVKVAGTEPVLVRTAQLLAEQLRGVGVALSVQSVDAGTLRSLFRTRDFDMHAATIGAHGVADPDQFIMSHRSGYLWKAGLPYPEWDDLYEKWEQAQTAEERKAISFRMQALFNRQPTSIALYYPEETFALNTERFGGWAEARGFGVVNKWSFLPPDVRDGAVVQTLGG